MARKQAALLSVVEVDHDDNPIRHHHRRRCILHSSCVVRLRCECAGGENAKMKTFASLFSGGGGADIGAKAAGLQLAWGVELMPEIAEVGNANLGQHIEVANILACDPARFDRVDVLHASPPCTRASVANGSAEVNEDGLREAPLDIALANKTIEFVETLQPEIFTLENVWGYRKFQSWRGGRKCEGIQQALYRLGYWVSVEHVNSADMAVPQTRCRMIVRAIRGGMVPYLPQPVPWVGWYAAIQDIIDTLPESQFAPWQLARLPEELKSTVLFTTEHHKESPIGREGRGGIIPTTEPANTVVTGSGGSAKAFLINGDNATRDCSVRTITEPTFTVTDGRKHPLKAFLVGKQYDSPNSNIDRCVQTRQSHEPALTVVTRTGDEKAFDGAGRVVAITPRALARFQSFPDSYTLTDSKTLAAKIIGNAVPPLMMQRIYEGMMNL